ncbi:MAG: choice-of-anchor L domain-containing protein [Alphaproteobacteria bacterium]|nr:choice-of-anchor L domain-containing protein [Alphaproteobacteria bacterium]
MRVMKFWLLALVGLVLAAAPAAATVTVTTSTTAATLAAAITAGNSGITLTGTPTLSVGASTTSSGTFTTTGSNLGIASGIVLSTGNISQIAGAAPGPGNISNAGSGVTPSPNPANEFDVATFTFSFIPKPGVNKMSIASVFMSEEYNEYVNTTFTDNFSMVVNGGAYTNFNIATVPGTSTGTDINTVNNGSNAGYYRDNTVAPYPIPDIKYDGATTVFINAFAVVPGTTYTLTIRIADVGDTAYDSSAFVSSSTVLNNPPALDLSAAAAGTGYSTTWVEGQAPVAIAAADDTISDDGTTISSATITLASPAAGDVLAAGTLPAGIVASAYNSSTGVLTLTGVATLAQYQTALQAITYSSTAANPAGPAKSITVIVNDGVDNSNTTTATINMATLSIVKTAGAPTTNKGTNLTLTDAGDTIAFTYVVNNTGNVALTVVKPVEAGPTFNGVAGTGTLSAFTPATASIAAGGSQTFTATYTLSAADVMNAAGITNGVSNTATATGTAPTGTVNSSSSTATTSILTVAGLTVTKTASAPTIAAGSNTTLTDAGDTITFTYVVKNVGSVALTAIAPTDVGPKFNAIAGTNALSAFSPASVATLAAGASTTFTATYTLSATDVKNAVGITGGVTNTATASGKNGATTITSPASNASTTITAVPGMTIAKTYVLTDIGGGTTGKADLGETVTYTYVITNNGNVPMNNVQVKDMHGTPAVLVSLGAGGITSETLSTPGPLGAAASTNTTPNDGIWDVLAPGASVTFTWSHLVTQAEIDHG